MKSQEQIRKEVDRFLMEYLKFKKVPWINFMEFRMYREMMFNGIYLYSAY